MKTPGLAAGVFILLSRGHLEIFGNLQMIAVTRLNGKSFVVNAALIRYIESTPDTMITLIGGEKVIVKEPLEEVVERAIQYNRKIRVFDE